MSVQPGPTFKRYAANGIAPTYAIPFLLLDAADLQITLDGILITSGFTLAGIGNPASSCTFTVPPLGDLLFQQVMPFQRLTDYQINGDLLAQTLNPDFDRVWLAVKQLLRDNGRALTAPLLEPEGIPPLPVIANRALKMLAFDAQGQPIPSNLTIEQIEQQPALALESAAAAATSAIEAGDSQAAAADSAAAADTSELLASKWAENPEDVPVTTGPDKFSAKHWAAKAAAALSGLVVRVVSLEAKGKLLWVRDEKPNGTNGGGMTSGAYRTRTLNAVKINEITGASLNSNQVTLPAGTYRFQATSVSYNISQVRLRLQNVTTASPLCESVNIGRLGTGTLSTTYFSIAGQFTLAATSAIELQMISSTTNATDGMGEAASLGTVEVYSDLQIQTK